MSDSDEPVSKRLRPQKVTIKQQKHPHPIDPSKVNPSPENAPRNSLLRLDEKCLTKLFEYLDTGALCTMANTCKRFRSIAEKVFSEQYNEFQCPGRYDRSKLRRVIRKFGQFITSFIDPYGLDPNDIKAIVKYCWRLRKISLANTEIDCKKIKPLFPQLTDISLDSCDFDGNPKGLFEYCSNLEHLFFDPGAEGDDFKFLIRKYRKLIELAIDCNPPTNAIVYPLLESNPQIKKLTLMAIADDNWIANVVECVKKVEHLTIRPHGMFKEPEEQTKRGLLQLTKLKKLTHLSLDASYEDYAELIGPLADAFAKAKVPLEKLDLRDVYIGAEDIKSINKLKTMKRLLLNEMKNVNETDLISLTVDLPALIELQLYFNYGIDKVITVDGLVNMIKNAKHLEFIALVGIQNLRIDEEAFEKLLNAVRNTQKLTIHIIGCKSTTGFNVPENIRNAKRLKIVYMEDDDYRCQCKHCQEVDEDDDDQEKENKPATSSKGEEKGKQD